MTLHKSGIQEVTLKEELEVLQKYVEIEQTRFGSRLQVTMQIEPETLDAQVPNLLLQPLVENAIRHGIAPNARPGWIAVRASREGDQLVVAIRDSGDGLPPERLMALNRGVRHQLPRRQGTAGGPGAGPPAGQRPAAPRPERHNRLVVKSSGRIYFVRIQELRPSFNGEYIIVLHDQTRLALSRGYGQGLQARLGKSL